MQMYEILYECDGTKSWIYYYSTEKKYEKDGLKKYKSFTYGWKSKTKFISVNRIRQVHETTFVTRKSPEFKPTIERKSTKPRNKTNTPATTKRTRPTRRRTPDPIKPKADKKIGSTSKTRVKPTPKAKSTRVRSGTSTRKHRTKSS